MIDSTIERNDVCEKYHCQAPRIGHANSMEYTKYHVEDVHNCSLLTYIQSVV